MRNCHHIATHLVLVGPIASKNLRIRRSESDRDDMWNGCSSSEYASIDESAFDMTSHFQYGSHDVRPPLTAAYAGASAGCLLDRRAVCATVPDPQYICTVLVITRSWVRASLAPGCRVATMGQLLFAPWAWAYSTFHP